MNEAATSPRLEVFPDREVLAEAVASVIAETLQAALCESERASFVATGGSTPAPAYEQLCRWPLDWTGVSVTLTDERFVDPASPESNGRLLRDHLLKGAAAGATFVPLWSSAVSAAAAAAAAEPHVAEIVPFDVALLGMGEDGHIASLFPGSPALAAGLDPTGQRLCIGVPAGSPAPPQPRISLTLRALLEARLILILITGEPKRRTLEAAFAGADLPVAAVLRQSRTPVRVLWSA